MPSIPIPGGRRSKRIVLKKPARLVISLDGVQEIGFPVSLSIDHKKDSD